MNESQNENIFSQPGEDLIKTKYLSPPKRTVGLEEGRKQNIFSQPGDGPQGVEDMRKQQQFLKLADTYLHRDQLRVVNVLRGQSKCESMDAEAELEKKLAAVGVKNITLDEIAKYIMEDAPITINLSEATVKILTEDTHYRSTFETNTKGDQYLKSRYQWESECFHDLYNVKSITNFDRPKYGALNYLNQPAGIPSARNYGSWFMTLSADRKLRNRVTIAAGDTAGSRTLGVLDYCNHVLKTFSGQELVALAGVIAGTGKPKYGNSIYKEIQVHGELQLDRDVVSLHVPKNDLRSKTAQAFCEKFGLALISQER